MEGNGENEYLKKELIHDVEQGKKVLEKVVNLYNNERPHYSLNMETPDSIHNNKNKYHNVKTTKYKKYYKILK